MSCEYDWLYSFIHNKIENKNRQTDLKMGIKYLNKYLTEKCKSIRKLHLKCFEGRTIVIDTSIFMYKFLSENALIENMQKMIKIFQDYNINPVFIFDGKPPPEKRDLLAQRQLLKWKAEEKYKELSKCESPNEKELHLLKNQFLKISEDDIRVVKELFTLMGVRFYDSTIEADPVCVYFVNSKNAFACLTEDMDMFVYGCHRILRNIDLDKHEIQYYNIKLILKDLNISYHHFKQILVLSGTDYNISSSVNLFTTFSLFEKFKTTTKNINKKCFYEWLNEYQRNYIKDRDKLKHCFEMFNLEYYINDLESFTKITSIACMNTVKV